MPSVRLPLQSGASSQYIVRWIPLFFPFIAAGVALFQAGLVTNVVLTFFGALVLLVIGAPMLLTLRGAYRERANDLIADQVGLASTGGRLGRRSFAWAEIADSEAENDTSDRYGTKQNERIALVLRIVLASGDNVELARAVDPDEQHSLLVVRDAIRHALGKDGAPTPTGTPSVVACSRCGGAVAPSSAVRTACPYCGAPVEMPELVRQRVTASAAIDAAHVGQDLIVHRLIAQPGPRLVNVLLLAASVAYLTGVPIMVVGIVQAIRGSLPWAVALVALGAMVILRGWARRAVVDRAALRGMTTGFGARPPQRPNAPYSCRGCGAPLRDIDAGDERAVVRCAFCGVENVLGFGIFAAAGVAGQTRAELDYALASDSEQGRSSSSKFDSVWCASALRSW